MKHQEVRALANFQVKIEESKEELKFVLTEIDENIGLLGFKFVKDTFENYCKNQLPRSNWILIIQWQYYVSAKNKIETEIELIGGRTKQR